MNLDEIKELIALMRKHRISEIDLEQEGSKVRIVSEPSRTAPPAAVPSPAPIAGYYMAPPMEAPRVASYDPAAGAAPEARPAAPAPAAETTSPTAVEIKSPMVGTFYRAPAPDAPAYVEVGSVIQKNTVLCIIEAMKLLNEIKAEVAGKIVKVLVEDGQPVEYNQPLFLVEP